MGEIEREKKLRIIMTCSLQNDFVEKIEINKKKEDEIKLSFGTCQKAWSDYFFNPNISGEKKNIEDFLNWLKKEKAQYEDKNVVISYLNLIEKYKHRVHINYNESKRLLDDNNLYPFLTELMKKDCYFIHLRDWHDPTDLDQRVELNFFGNHCLKGTYGAHFIAPVKEGIKENLEHHLIVNSNNLSSFSDTKLESVLNLILKNEKSSKARVEIGIFGVITNVKVLLLTFELMVIHGYRNLFICEDACAGFNLESHNQGIDYISSIFGANVLDQKEFRTKFNF